MELWQEKPAKEVKAGDYLNWGDRPCEVSKVETIEGGVRLTVINPEDGLKKFDYDPDTVLEVKRS